MNLAIDSSTGLTGLLGRPIRHSLSPPIHNRAFAAAGLNWIYLAFDVAPEDLAAALKGARALGMKGLNLTHPHKQAAIPLLDRLSPEAEAVGAVNTVVFRKGESVGHNTDTAGFSDYLEGEGFALSGKKILVAGAGGAGRAVAWAAARRGASEVAAVDLDAERAARLCRDFQPLFPTTVFRPADSENKLKEALSSADLAVNATPVGMGAADPPVIPVASLPRSAWFMDLIYHPRRTATLKLAVESGREGRDGLGMLVRQAAAAWEIWTGREAPLDEMAAAAGFGAPGGSE